MDKVVGIVLALIRESILVCVPDRFFFLILGWRPKYQKEEKAVWQD